MKARTIQREGLIVFHIRHWHPVFAAWRETGKKVIVRYHPEDLSRVFVTADHKTYVEARCDDLRRPRISLWERRHALTLMKAQGQAGVSEAMIFKTIEQQRQLAARAKAVTQASRRTGPKSVKLLPSGSWGATRTGENEAPVDYGNRPNPTTSKFGEVTP